MTQLLPELLKEHYASVASFNALNDAETTIQNVKLAWVIALETLNNDIIQSTLYAKSNITSAPNNGSLTIRLTEFEFMDASTKNAERTPLFGWMSAHYSAQDGSYHLNRVEAEGRPAQLFTQDPSGLEFEDEVYQKITVFTKKTQPELNTTLSRPSPIDTPPKKNISLFANIIQHLITACIALLYILGILKPHANKSPTNRSTHCVTMFPKPSGHTTHLYTSTTLKAG